MNYCEVAKTIFYDIGMMPITNDRNGVTYSELFMTSGYYLLGLAIPGFVARNIGKLNSHFIPVARLIEKMNKLFLVSVVLSTFSGLALLRTAANTTANRVLKAGFAGFGTVAALVAIYGAVKLFQAFRTLPENA